MANVAAAKESAPNQVTARPVTKTAQALALAATHTVREIAAKIGTTPEAVRSTLHGKGVVAVAAKPAFEPKTDRNAELVAAIVAGGSQFEVAERFGISKARVAQLVKKHAPDFKPATRGARLRAVIEAGRHGVHPTEKPVALMCDLVADFAPADSTVLDPFMGSGTTGVACVREGRGFVGIELDERYFDIACQRIRDELRRPRLQLSTAAKPVQATMDWGVA